MIVQGRTSNKKEKRICYNFATDDENLQPHLYNVQECNLITSTTTQARYSLPCKKSTLCRCFSHLCNSAKSGPNQIEKNSAPFSGYTAPINMSQGRRVCNCVCFATTLSDDRQKVPLTGWVFVFLNLSNETDYS